MPPSPATDELDSRPAGPIPSPFAPGPTFGFKQPETPLPSATIPSPASSPEGDDETDPDSGDDWLHDEASESPDDTRSTGSSRVTNPLNGEGLRDTFRNGVQLVGHQAHQHLTRTPEQVEVGLYLADEDDAAKIGDPLSRIVQRREGLGEVSPDTADLLAAMMGLAGYATKQVQRAARAKELVAVTAAEHAPAVDL